MTSSVKTVESITTSTASPDGSRFVQAAPETLRLPGEELPVLRVLDSFVFLIKGKPIPLLKDWINHQNWDEIEVIGATATMTGSTTALVQCGWITRVKWRWVRITTITRVEIRKDSRFRKGELCFWLTTRLGEYAILSPHRGYLAAWDESIAQPEVPTPTPTFRRVSDHDPMPTWWDPVWGETWPPSVPEPTSGIKRTAPPVTQPNESSSGEQAGPSSHGGERRVRRREGGESIAADRLNAPEGDSPPVKPAVQEDGGEAGKPADSVKPELGVKMSRVWDITRDCIVRPRETS